MTSHSHKPTKILFVLPSLNAGGAERILTIVMNHLSQKGWDINLLLIKREGELLSLLSPDIRVLELGGRFSRRLKAFVRLINAEKPDILFSGVAGFNASVAFLSSFFNSKTKLAARETSVISHNISKRSQKFFYKFFFRRFDLVIAQCEAMKADMLRHTNIQPQKVKVIFNPYTHQPDRPVPSKAQHEGFTIVTVGRLARSKGIHKILDLLAQDPDPSTKAIIVGQGPEEVPLRQQAARLGLDSRVQFKGFLKDPTELFHEADIFILASEYEGFPNVVIEALWQGLPVLAHSSPGGIQEMIRPGRNGELVDMNDPQEAFNSYMKMKKNRHLYQSEDIAREARQTYAMEKAMAAYEHAIHALLI